MRLFGAASPKRHIAYGSSEWIEKLNLGVLKRWKPGMNPDRKTTRVYKKDGKTKYHGTRHLKPSQNHSSISSIASLSLIWKYTIENHGVLKRKLPKILGDRLRDHFPSIENDPKFQTIWLMMAYIKMASP